MYEWSRSLTWGVTATEWEHWWLYVAFHSLVDIADMSKYMHYCYQCKISHHYTWVSSLNPHLQSAGKITLQLHHQTEFFQYLRTHLTRTISCCVLHVWKSNTAQCLDSRWYTQKSARLFLQAHCWFDYAGAKFLVIPGTVNTPLGCPCWVKSVEMGSSVAEQLLGLLWPSCWFINFPTHPLWNFLDPSLLWAEVRIKWAGHKHYHKHQPFVHE